MLGIVGIKCDHTAVIRADRNGIHCDLFKRSDNLVAVIHLDIGVLHGNDRELARIITQFPVIIDNQLITGVHDIRVYDRF